MGHSVGFIINFLMALAIVIGVLLILWAFAGIIAFSSRSTSGNSADNVSVGY